MRFTKITLVDSILYIGVSIFILYNALKNLKLVLNIFLEITPKNIDVEEIKTAYFKN